MYVPQHFRVDDLRVIHDVVEQHAFGVLVTADGQGAPFATHLPFVLQRGEGAFGTLYAHMARANPHWQAFAGGVEALAIFQGEHGYVSPSWYENPESVPTWNYIAVHAYGVPRVIEDDAGMQRVLDALVSIYESPRPEPWSAAELPVEYLTRMRRAIVAFEMPIARIEGKFKLSQNRPPVDRARVMRELASSSHAGDRALAVAMEQWAPVQSRG